MSLVYRPDIDGLRAIAVGSVVLFHGGFKFVGGGFVGVDVFFVISGFLITSIIYPDMVAGRFSLADFYDRRIRRILPVLFLVLAVTTLLCTFTLLPAQMEEYARSLGPAVLFYANIHFMWLDSYFGPVAEQMPLLHLWSLAIEEQFYIVFPLFLWLLARFAGVRTTIWFLVLVAVLSLAHAEIEFAGDARRAFYLLSCRVWEFLFGAFLAIAPLPKIKHRTANILGLLGLVALLVPVFVYRESTPFPGVHALPPVLGTALIIFAGMNAPTTIVARVLAMKGFVQIGRISYSLYLWHWPLLSLAFVYKGRHLTNLEAGILILLAIGLSFLSWKYVEMPLRKPQAFFGRRSYRFAGAILGIAIVFAGARGLEAINGQLWPNTPLGEKANSVVAQVRTPRECDEAERKAAPKFDLARTNCIMGPGAATGKYEVLVWGDSHAGSTFSGIGEAAERLGLTTRLISRPGCPPLVGVLPAVRNIIDHPCFDFNAAVLKEIEKAKPRLVVLVGRWAMWTHYTREGVAALLMPDLPDAQEPTREVSIAVFPVAVERTIQAIRAAGANVLILGQAPEFVQQPAQCVAYREYFIGDSSACYTAPREKSTLFVSPSNAVIAEKVKDRPGVSAVYLQDVFCDQKTCTSGQGEEFYYRDQDHITPEGARIVGQFPGVISALEAVATRVDTPRPETPN
ncbi:acyltransferase family protein [Xanthobacter sp. TB0136]|uniref:acyltransferase family protein n=1 Tax=Xanthobacter sp. TB0136 TaxID=3459177 RepID=UPI004039A473